MYSSHGLNFKWYTTLIAYELIYNGCINANLAFVSPKYNLPNMQSNEISYSDSNCKTCWPCVGEFVLVLLHYFLLHHIKLCAEVFFPSKVDCSVFMVGMYKELILTMCECIKYRSKGTKCNLVLTSKDP